MEHDRNKRAGGCPWRKCGWENLADVLGLDVDAGHELVEAHVGLQHAELVRFLVLQCRVDHLLSEEGGGCNREVAW
jgi:hypothetical protein